MGSDRALEPTDQELLERLGTRDVDAYGELAARHRKRLEALAFSLMTPALRRAHPVEDIVQEALTRGLESVGSFCLRTVAGSSPRDLPAPSTTAADPKLALESAAVVE